MGCRVSKVVDVSNRKAPKRGVVEILKKGSWGKYEYWHRLDCGHTEIRKRAAPTDKIACRLCVKAEEKGRELSALATVPQRQIFDEDLIALEEDHLVDLEAGSLRGSLSSVLEIPQEAVDVIVSDVDGRLTVSSVVIFLSALDAKRIAKII